MQNPILRSKCCVYDHVYMCLLAARIRNYNVEKIIHFYDSQYGSHFLKSSHFIEKTMVHQESVSP